MHEPFRVRIDGNEIAPTWDLFFDEEQNHAFRKCWPEESQCSGADYE
jgi:hypothetical protein